MVKLTRPMPFRSKEAAHWWGPEPELITAPIPQPTAGRLFLVPSLRCGLLCAEEGRLRRASEVSRFQFGLRMPGRLRTGADSIWRG